MPYGIDEILFDRNFEYEMPKTSCLEMASIANRKIITLVNGPNDQPTRSKAMSFSTASSHVNKCYLIQTRFWLRRNVWWHFRHELHIKGQISQSKAGGYDKRVFIAWYELVYSEI